MLVGVWAAAWLVNRRAATQSWQEHRTANEVGGSHRQAAPSETERGRFDEAQSHYLKGEWREAERVLREILHADNQDVEARLMLATLCRHRGRYDEATQELDRIERFESAESWRFEIAEERNRIAEATDGHLGRYRRAPPREHPGPPSLDGKPPSGTRSLPPG